MSAFVVSTDTIDLIVSALQRVQGPALSSTLGLQTIGADLLAENYRSVNARYNESAQTPAYVFQPVDLDAIPEWRVVALKSLRCWQYQACETDDFEDTTAYHMAKALMGLLGVSDKHPAYESAPWGWERGITVSQSEPQPVARESLSTTEHAARIRQTLKRDHGWTSRQVYGGGRVMTTPQADIVTSFYGSIVTFDPQTAKGRRWLTRNIGHERMAEHRYGIDIIHGAINDGLRVQDAQSGRIAERAS